MKTGDKNRVPLFGRQLNPTTTTNSTTRIPQVKRNSGSSFERVQGSNASRAGFGGLVGKLGQTASQIGFDVMQKYASLTQTGKRVAIGSAIGFVLLIPPGTGQLMHPGAPSGTSPIAVMMQEKAEIQTGERIRQDNAALRHEIPSGTGAAREIAILEVIQHYEGAKKTGQNISSLASSANQTISDLRETVGFDARLGYGADWYWFGVPNDHANFHAGRNDAKGLQDHASGVRSALTEVRAEARNEVSKLLIDESPAYAALYADYRHEVLRLEAATNIRDLADGASDALGTASNAILMRNITPMTVSEPVYDSEGKVTGTRQVPNPTWYTWNAIAVASKASAETKIRSLNEAVTTNRELLDINGGAVDDNLITGWDFFGQPSFLVWSFDSQDVDRAERAADALRDQMNGMIGDIHEVHDPLERAVNEQIDARWIELGGHPDSPSPESPDQDARLQRQSRIRRRKDGQLDFDA